MSIGEHEYVVLTRDLAESGLRRGDVGVVVHIYSDHRAYEVEFAQHVLTVQVADVRRKDECEELHVRQ